MGSRHILKEKFTELACGLDTKWGQVTIREGLKRCHLLVHGKQQGLGEWGTGWEWNLEARSRLRCLLYIQVEMSRRLLISELELREVEGPRYTSGRQLWEWIGPPRKVLEQKAWGWGY